MYSFVELLPPEECELAAASVPLPSGIRFKRPREDHNPLLRWWNGAREVHPPSDATRAAAAEPLPLPRPRDATTRTPAIQGLYTARHRRRGETPRGLQTLSGGEAATTTTTTAVVPTRRTSTWSA